MENTTHYNLKKWDPQDRVLRTDFNDNNDKIDAGIAQALAAAESAGATAASALQTATAAYASCRLETGTYVGNGKGGGQTPNSLTFSGTPYFVIIGTAANGLILHMVRSAPHGTLLNGVNDTIYLTWTGKTVKWYSNYSAGYQMNENGTTYFYIAFTQL